VAGFNPKSINIGVGLDLKGIQTGVQQMQREMGKISQTTQRVSNGFQNMGRMIGGAFAVGSIVSFARSATLMAEQTATAKARIDQIAKSMGVFGEETQNVTGHIKKYAEDNEILLATDRNVIMMTQAKLLTFKELAVTAGQLNGAFNRATKAAIDMAAAGFGEATMNAVQLGKALNDPIKGITALTRNGITFTEQEKEKIKVLVESNRMLEAQNMVLSAIETQVGGTAAATADASVKINLHFKSISRTIGEMLLPAVERLAEKLGNIQRLGLATGMGISVRKVKEFEDEATSDVERLKARIKDKTVTEQYAAIQRELNHAMEQQTAIVYEDITATQRRTVFYKKQVELLEEMKEAFVSLNSPTIQPSIISDVDAPKVEPVVLTRLKKIQMQAKLTGDAVRFEIGSIPATLEEVGNDLKAPFGLIDEQFHNFVASVRAAVAEFSALMLVDFASAIGEALVVGNDSFKDFGQRMLDNMGRFFKQIGSMFVAYGVASLEFMKTLLVPANAPALIAAGLALAAIGGAISATAKNYAEQNGTMSSSVSGASGAFYSETRIDGYDLVTINARNNHLRTRRG
jgi:hypothetical protein